MAKTDHQRGTSFWISDDRLRWPRGGSNPRHRDRASVLSIFAHLRQRTRKIQILTQIPKKTRHCCSCWIEGCSGCQSLPKESHDQRTWALVLFWGTYEAGGLERKIFPRLPTADVQFVPCPLVPSPHSTLRRAAAAAALLWAEAPNQGSATGPGCRMHACPKHEVRLVEASATAAWRTVGCRDLGRSAKDALSVYLSWQKEPLAAELRGPWAAWPPTWSQRGGPPASGQSRSRWTLQKD